MKKKVLVVEDDLSIQAMFLAGLSRHGFEILQATTIERAQFLFWDHPDIAVIVVDGCVPGRMLNTIPLVKEFRSMGFHRPMIAISGDESFRQALCEAGCDAMCLKQDLIDMLPRIVQNNA